jgi:hypothetical protein
MDLGSLKEVIHDWKHIDYDELVIGAAAFQMLWGLAYLHYERRLHRDIKPQVSALCRYLLPLFEPHVSFGTGCSRSVLVPVAHRMIILSVSLKSSHDAAYDAKHHS